MNWLAGIALGALVGLLLGLSASPVVASSVGALLAIVVTFFGFGGSIGPISVEASGSRILAFSVAMALAVVGGVLLRSYGVLAPSVADRVANWERAGYDAGRARELATFEVLGILPQGATKAAATAPTPGSGLLFSKADSGDCAVLDARHFATPQDRLRAMINTGAPWSALGKMTLPEVPDQLSATLEAAWQVACAD